MLPLALLTIDILHAIAVWEPPRRLVRELVRHGVAPDAFTVLQHGQTGVYGP